MKKILEKSFCLCLKGETTDLSDDFRLNFCVASIPDVEALQQETHVGRS